MIVKSPEYIIDTLPVSGVAFNRSGVHMRRWLKWFFFLLLSSLLSACGYNNLQAGDEQIKASWAEVVNQYQRRADLVPNLVNTV